MNEVNGWSLSLDLVVHAIAIPNLQQRPKQFHCAVHIRRLDQSPSSAIYAIVDQSICSQGFLFWPPSIRTCSSQLSLQPPNIVNLLLSTR